MKYFEIGDLVTIKTIRDLQDIEKDRGVIVKELSELKFGKPIYRVIWQDSMKESYEPHEYLERYNEERRLSESKRPSKSSTKSPKTPE